MSIEESAPRRPDWMTDLFLKHCIKNDLEILALDDIQIQDLQIQYAIPKGENFSSLILRIIIKASLNTRHLVNKKYVLKALNKYEGFEALVEEGAYVEREIDMYETMIPKIQRILDEAGIPTNFSCRCINYDMEAGVIVMEDLSKMGFALVSRINGADLEHCELILNKCARLHAASMHYYQQNGVSAIEKYYFKGFFRRFEDETLKQISEKMIGKPFMHQKMLDVAELLKNRPGYDREAEVFENLKDDTLDLLCDVYTYQSDNKFNALLHGDAHINNTMFTYDQNGQLKDAMLVDFQCSIYNSVAIEFLYFFLSSTNNDVRRHHYRYLVNFYFEQLIDSLEKVGYQGEKITLEEFKEEILSKSPLGLFSVSCMLLIMKTDHGSTANDRTEKDVLLIEDMEKLSSDTRNSSVYLESFFATVDMLKDAGIIDYYLNNLVKNKKSNAHQAE